MFGFSFMMMGAFEPSDVLASFPHYSFSKAQDLYFLRFLSLIDSMKNSFCSLLLF